MRASSRFVVPVLSVLFANREVSLMHDQASYDPIFKYYGFLLPAQRQAMYSLLEQADALDPSRDEASKILSMVKKTQENFVVRTHQQERWETQEPLWARRHPEAILEQLKTLGFVDAKKPRSWRYDAVCILGGAAPSMKQRIDYVEGLMQEGLATKNILLLAGERFVTQGVDGSGEALALLADKKNVPWQNLTETHLMQDLYLNSGLKDQKIPVHLLDTPKGDLPRPTTQSTMLYLLVWLKKHPEIKSILFISHQPYIAYQKAVIASMIKTENQDLDYEVVGSAALTPRLQIKSLIEGLGSYLWAETPRVLTQMQPPLNALECESLKKLYAKNPIFYETLKDLASCDMQDHAPGSPRFN